MPSLATVSQVIEMGALRPELFDFAEGDDTSLEALVQRWINANDLHIQGKAGDNYASTDPVVIGNLQMGEVFLTLADLVAQIGARKVYGTHYPIDTEDSQSFFADTGSLEAFYRQRATEFLSDYFVIDEPGTSVVLPVFLVSTDVDPLTEQSVLDDLEGFLDEASGFTRQVTVPSVGP